MCTYGAVPSTSRLQITLSDTYTGTYMLTHTWTHICSTHGHRQASTCQRICDYNQINWSISPWKHSFQLDAAYTNQKPGNRHKGQRGHSTLSGISIPLWRTCSKNYYSTYSSFRLTRGGISICFPRRVLTHLSCTLFWLNLTQRIFFFIT